MKKPKLAAPSYDSFAMLLATSPMPFSVQPFLFDGRAALSFHEARAIQSDNGFVPDRIPLVVAIHDKLLAKRVGGTPDKTITNYFYGLKAFITWSDEHGYKLSLKTLRNVYVNYANHLYKRSTVISDLSEDSAFTIGSALAAVVNDVLGLKKGVLSLTHLRKPPPTPPWKKGQDATLDKDSFRFGKALLKLSTALDLETLSAELPIEVELEPDKLLKIGLRWHRNEIPRLPCGAVYTTQLCETRSALVNLRIEAELLIFISQTGLNIEQVRTLTNAPYRFDKMKSMPGFLEVRRAYKGRRGGEVEFEIHSNYKPLFIRYLAFRDTIFPEANEGLLFEFLDVNGKSKPRYYDLCSVKRRLDSIGFPYRGPRQLRAARENFLLDKTGNILLAAEMGQHSPEVFVKNYARPSFGTLLREVATFHQAQDAVATPPAPGACKTKAPSKIEGAPNEAPNPDCGSPAGCFFCVMHRDIDSMEHVWSLLSYRHIKSMELSKSRSKDASLVPAYHVIRRVSEIVNAFASSNDQRSAWFVEAETRITEGWFHPAWKHMIEFAEERL